MEISKFLLHGDKIILIDEITYFDIEKISSKTIIKADNDFLQDNVFPTYKSIEMMAQTLGVYQGKLAELRGLKPRIGFLLGCRKFEIFKSALQINDVIKINAVQSIQDESGFGVYDCEMFCNDELAARASLNVLSPDDEFLERIMQ